MTTFLSLRKILMSICLIAPGIGAVQAFEPPVFALNDAQLKDFVRSSYEYVRNFGIARIGNFGEGCATGDMTYLALKLSDSGIGDYWDDADRYVRNHLAELQITDAAKLREATDLMPHGRGKYDTAKGPLDPLGETADRVVERNVGIFLSDLVLDNDAWRAREGYREKADHKAFAISLKGPWARSWEGGSVEEAEKEALDSCNRNEAAQKAPCFILMRDGASVPPEELQANPDLSVGGQKPK